MIIPAQMLSVLTIAALAAVALLALVVVVLAVRLRRLRGAVVGSISPGQRDDVLARIDGQAGDLDGLRDELERVGVRIEHLAERLGHSVSRLGVVRYDAFDDMGGALSFSAALLDEASNGVVISAINGRAETRCYAKPVAEGRSGNEYELSREELAAVTAALAGTHEQVLMAAPAGRTSIGRGRRRAS